MSIRLTRQLKYVFVSVFLAFLLALGAVPAAASNISQDVTRESGYFTGSPDIQFTMAVKLLQDVDKDGLAGPGDILQYSVSVRNNGTAQASGAVFFLSPEKSTILVTKSVTKTQGTVIQGNGTTHKTVKVNLGTIAQGATAGITFNVTVKSPVWVSQVSNQGTLTGYNFGTLKSDDPQTSTLSDATSLRIRSSPPVHGPGVSHWGIGVMVLLFGGIMIGLVRKKRLASSD